MKRNPNKVCVFLVEDDESIRQTMELVLESEGFEVHTACDGAEAMATIHKVRVLPDLVITDLMMPNMTGWELVDALHRLGRTSKIPIIVYSAVSHYNEGNRVLQGTYLVRKPVELDNLLNTIKRALSGPDKIEPELFAPMAGQIQEANRR